MSKGSKKLEQQWRWREIEDAINNIFVLDSHRDSWNVPVIYETSLLRVLKRQLKNPPPR